MAHLIFIGLDYQPKDLKWSVVNTTDFERVYNYLTPESIIFTNGDLLKCKETYKRHLLIKLHSPQIQLYSVDSDTEYKYIKSISHDSIEKAISAISRKFELVDKRVLVKDISNLILD